MNTTLTTSERFDKLCDTVDKAIEHWYEAALALKEIADTKIYLERYSSWEEFVMKRFGISRAYSYRMIRAGEAKLIADESGVEDLSQAAYRAMEGVPAEKVPEVVAKAKKSSPTGKPTAAAIKEAAPIVDVDDEEADAAPLEMDDPVANAAVLRDSVKMIRSAIKAIKGFDDGLWGLELAAARRKAILAHLEEAAAVIVASTPIAICDRCDGAGCDRCGNHGWVTRRNK